MRENQNKTLLIFLILVLHNFCLAQKVSDTGIKQPDTKHFAFKMSMANLLIGDYVTRSWSPNIVIEKSLKNNFSFQQEAGVILRDNLTDKSEILIKVDKMFGIRSNTEFKKYINHNTANSKLEGAYISLSSSFVFTKSELSVSDARVSRWVVTPRVNAGYQFIDKFFLCDLTVGFGPAFVFSSSSVSKENLGILFYHKNILYQGGSGIYPSIYIDAKIGF